jgi:uncharacterized protein YggE
MQTAKGSTRTQKLIAVGAIVALAILSTQAYAYVTSGSLSTIGIHNAGGSVDPTNSSTISVTGNGQVNIQPDRALLTIGVNTQDSSAQQAAQENANIMTNIISALGNLGINSSEIQTVSYNIYQQYGYATPVQPVICGTPLNDTSCKVPGATYQVDNEIQVTIAVSSQTAAQLGTKVGAAIDAAVGAGANEVYGVQFTASSSVLQQADQQALQQAVKDASAQAASIASALGVSVTGVISVTTSPTYLPSPVYYATPSAGTASQTPVVAPQSLTITESVQAVYAIS